MMRGRPALRGELIQRRPASARSGSCVANRSSLPPAESKERLLLGALTHSLLWPELLPCPLWDQEALAWVVFGGLGPFAGLGLRRNGKETKLQEVLVLFGVTGHLCLILQGSVGRELGLPLGKVWQEVRATRQKDARGISPSVPASLGTWLSGLGLCIGRAHGPRPLTHETPSVFLSREPDRVWEWGGLQTARSSPAEGRGQERVSSWVLGPYQSVWLEYGQAGVRFPGPDG